MAEDGRVRIEKFNGTDFAWWKMQIEALLGECDLDMVLEEKLDGMVKAAEAIWDSKDKKARGKITLALTRSVAFNIMKETTARGNLKFDRIRDSVLGEDIRRRNASGGFTSGLLSVSRGRGNNRNSGSRGKSSSKAGKNVVCWVCKEVGHVKSQCPNKKNEISAVVGNASDDDSDALILSMESYVDSWVMDSGASFHAMHSGEAMVNLKKGDFGKVKLGNGKILKVTGMGDIDLKTSFGTTWSLQNVRVIPRLKTKLISGFRDSGSMGRVPSTVLKRRWVLRTKNPNVKISPGNSLLDLESGNGPRCISGPGGLCKPVETGGGYSHDWVGARWSFNCPFRLLMKGVVATRGYNWSLSLFLGTGGLEDLTVKTNVLLMMGLLGWHLCLCEILQVGDCWVIQ
ncbi:unnamed protein product [Cuscuta campestris]|uniref:CCHC-type domain-containing protein n=1 Tax=Cuscuta campestris TaxID=132261 RepID=A0A484N5H7_9ASTE|nr:unnamed protein product [Cuscuta campestris]